MADPIRRISAPAVANLIESEAPRYIPISVSLANEYAGAAADPSAL